MRSTNKTRSIYFICLACLIIVMLVPACERKAPQVERTVLVFGTLIEIVLYDVDEQHAERALNNLEQDFHAWHANWTPWEPSALRRINQLIKTGDSFAIAPSVLPLIKESIKLSGTSHGYFNPAIGNLIALWQFHRHDEPDIKPPPQKEIEALVKQNPQMSDIELDGIKLKSSNPAVQFNFGAFAKGYAIDQSMQYLHAEGIDNAIINAGGDLSVSGRHGDRSWRVGIRHPRNNSTLAWVEAFDGDSVFTSGDYERYYFHNGKRYHHILDPKTGYPAWGTASITVIHDNAGEADAAATALFVAGPKHWREVARSMGIRYVMLVDTEGDIYMSPAMADRVHFLEDNPGNILLSEPL